MERRGFSITWVERERFVSTQGYESCHLTKRNPHALKNQSFWTRYVTPCGWSIIAWTQRWCIPMYWIKADWQWKVRRMIC